MPNDTDSSVLNVTLLPMPRAIGALMHRPGEGGYWLERDGETIAEGRTFLDLARDMASARPRLPGIPCRCSVLVLKRKLLSDARCYLNEGESITAFLVAAARANAAKGNPWAACQSTLGKATAAAIASASTA